jgi:hypothetical protein
MNVVLEMRKDLAGLVIIMVLFAMDYLKIDDPALKYLLMGGLTSLFGFGAAQTAIPALNNGSIAKIAAANPAPVVQPVVVQQAPASASGVTITAPSINIEGKVAPQQ